MQSFSVACTREPQISRVSSNIDTERRDSAPYV
jgi:hypothetical protein